MGWANARRPIVVAHRGLHREFPENSLEAFGAAWREGVEWCECDVHASAEGEPVVLHDETLDRTTTGRGPVRDYHWRELAGLRLKTADGCEPQCRLPLLKELVELVPGGGGLLVEVKPADRRELVRRVLDLCRGRSCVIQSFEPAPLLAAWGAGLPLALLVGRREELPYVAAAQVDAIHIDHRLLDASVAGRVKSAGKVLGVWTVNAPADVRRVLSLGVEVIITDEPLAVREIVRDKPPQIGYQNR